MDFKGILGVWTIAHVNNLKLRISELVLEYRGSLLKVVPSYGQETHTL